MNDAGPPVLTRDWLAGYFAIYPQGLGVRRYGHSDVDARQAILRQIAALNRALNAHTDDGECRTSDYCGGVDSDVNLLAPSHALCQMQAHQGQKSQRGG